MKTEEFQKLIEQMLNHFVAYWDYSEHNDGEPYPSRVDTLFGRYEELKDQVIGAYSQKPDITEGVIDEMVEEVEDMYPYKESGNRDSYSQYNEGWADACDILGQRIKAALQLIKEK